MDRDGRARPNHSESGAGPFFQRLEALRALRSRHRIAVFVEYDYLPLADEKAPFAADAVVQSGFTAEDRTLALRADDELVSEKPASVRR